ncbi:hypothetical protein HK096_002769, partial [Nowakowskiella sp. JEL0078]
MEESSESESSHADLDSPVPHNHSTAALSQHIPPTNISPIPSSAANPSSLTSLRNASSTSADTPNPILPAESDVDDNVSTLTMRIPWWSRLRQSDPPSEPAPLTPAEALQRAHQTQLRYNQLLALRTNIHHITTQLSLIYGISHFVTISSLLFYSSAVYLNQCDTPLAWYLVISTGLVMLTTPKRLYESWLELRPDLVFSAFVRVLDGLWFLIGSFSFCWFLVGSVYIILDISTRFEKTCRVKNPIIFWLTIGELIFRFLYFICINIFLDNYIYWYITCYLGIYAPPEMIFTQNDQPSLIGITESELRTLKTFEFKASIPPVPIVPATGQTSSSKIDLKYDFPVASKPKTSRRLVTQVGLSYSVPLRSSSERRMLQHSDISLDVAPTTTSVRRSHSVNETTTSLAASRAEAMRVQLLADNSVLSNLATGKFATFASARSLSLRLSSNSSSDNTRTNTLSSPSLLYLRSAILPPNNISHSLNVINVSTSTIEQPKLKRQQSTASSRSILSTRSFLSSFISPPEIPEEDCESSDSKICAICVCEYENGEIVRMLACGHCFHMACVDFWLIGDLRSVRGGHRTCPLCACDAVDSSGVRE